MTAPQIVFVDGPTGVGKDYFIDRFICTHHSTVPGVEIESVRAADTVLKHAASEDRKYTAYNTPADLASSIYEGHLGLLQLLKSMAKQNKVLVVNRSYLSYWIYNWQTLEAFNRTGRAPSIDQVLQDTRVEQYAQSYRELIGDIPTLFVRLQTQESGSAAAVRTLVRRAKARGDGKPVDEQWLANLFDQYADPPQAFLDLFTHTEVMTGEDYALALARYFY